MPQDRPQLRRMARRTAVAASAACLNLGRRVRVLRPDGERSALAVSLTPDYGLAVRYDDGTEEVLRSGEVSVRGLYGYTDKE